MAENADVQIRFFCETSLYYQSNTKLKCYVCPTGTFLGEAECILCPPGGFYQDFMGYIGEPISHGLGCKECPPGRYVAPDAAPGRAITECTSCPQGTQYDGFAKFRACHCLQGFYRLDRFGPCFQCPSKGLICKNESVNLSPGFYWKWESSVSLETYTNFTEELQVQSKYYSKKYVKFPGSFPRVYGCPFPSSCLGGMAASCLRGYEGPLCAVCSKKYYRMISSCQECPTKEWLIGQILLASLFLFLIVLPLIFSKKIRSSAGRSPMDIALARLKILIGFYQVTSGTLDAFSYIEWPELMLKIGAYAKFLQLNLLQIAPVNCFTNNFKVTTYTAFLASLSVIAAVMVLSIAFYHLRKFYFRKINGPNMQGFETSVEGTKEMCFRYVFLITFIVYPMMSAQVFQVLPASCQNICVDREGKSCKAYLRSDYHLECYTVTYKKFAILAFSLLTFVIGFPVIIIFLLWKYHKMEPNNGDSRNEIEKGLSFLYENYSENCWFWEVLELVRKVILTSVVLLIGGESRTNVGVAAIMSGLYTVLFASFQPISDRFEHWLQLVSLLATCGNLNAGMLLRIPEENISSGVQSEFEATGVTVLLVSVNVLVTVMIAVRYLAALLTVIRALRKNPQCNFECCIAVIMMMNDAAEDVVMFQQEDEEQTSHVDSTDKTPPTKLLEHQPKKI